MPLYRELTDLEWEGKIEFFRENYSPCRLCPRECGAEREKDKKGVCGAVRDVKVASCNLHYGEEPPVSGEMGSGTIFYSGCPMKCIFCQNFPISHLFNGQFYSIDELAVLFLDLQDRGAHNINFVSPTPYLYHAAAALRIAARKGLNIPIVYNTSGYERPEMIAKLEGLVDIYMPDLKYHDNSLAPLVSGIRDYFDSAFPAVQEMFRQVGELQTDGDGIAVKGMILRHLLLPGQVENSKKVLEIISRSSFRDAALSLMCQYFPAYRAAEKPGMDRRVSEEEYDEVRDYALGLGFENGWFQDPHAPGGA